MEATEWRSSRMGIPLPFLEDSQEDENIDGPNALESPPAGRVRDPDRKRLLRSVSAEDAAEDATEAV
jgi:hypothetical protein